MKPMKPQVVLDQVRALGRDLRERVTPFDEQACTVAARGGPTSPRTVYVVGDGDSHHAACAAELAFESLGGVACEPMSALRFLEYGAPAMRYAAGPALVVLTSASGETERVLQCAERAREHGARTVALSGTPGSALVSATDDALILDLPGKVPSPGVRTYQASLLGLLLLAVRTGQALGAHAEGAADALVGEVAALADHVDATNALLDGCAEDVAGGIARAPVMAFVGSGPHQGTAMFGAAKMVETAGVAALAQDVEEWTHVERFALPADMPVIVVAPPSRSRWRVTGMAEQASALGRRVVAVTDEEFGSSGGAGSAGDTPLASYASTVLPVRGRTREEFSVLLYHLFAAHLAGHVASFLGRTPFQAGRG
jgi:glucosamine--fructose-6-phosphate aminotransferase (isomerizing)